ncbi:uncharacterized protein LOC111320543 [Stylophora pistillata]|uniref:uncharacterized protein LOC111320543 n=1 Tax=Stylophora pistillata TaxID=50429 RepID=UPI000C047AE3|nr:uncharacterized protein LOC111320543 [Stylophora pistillata]
MGDIATYITFSEWERGETLFQAYPAMDFLFLPRTKDSDNSKTWCALCGLVQTTILVETLVYGQAGSDRTNVCWVKEGCSSLKPAACSSLPLEAVEQVVDFGDPEKLNLHLNKGCYTGASALQNQLNNAPASCNAPCFRIKKPGKYCYMGTRNNNFSNRRHIGVIEVVSPKKST